MAEDKSADGRSVVRVLDALTDPGSRELMGRVVRLGDAVSGPGLLEVFSPPDPAAAVYEVEKKGRGIFFDILAADLEGPGRLDRIRDLNRLQELAPDLELVIFAEDLKEAGLLLRPEKARVLARPEDEGLLYQLLLAVGQKARAEREARTAKREKLDLKENLIGLQAALETIEDGFYETDLVGDMVRFNEALRSMLGYDRAELKGLNNRAFMDEENAALVYKTFNQVYRTGRPAKAVDWELRPKDQPPRAIEASVSLRRGPDGRPIGFVGITRDISEKKRAEEALRESEKKYRALFDNALVGILRISLENEDILEANDFLVRMSGYSSLEEMRALFSLKKHFPLAEERERLLGAIREKGRVERKRVHFVRHGGEAGWAEFFGRADREEGYFEAVILDISERVRTEEAWRESETRYQDLFDNTRDLIMVHDLEGRIITLNPAGQAAFGAGPEEVLGSSPASFMPPEFQEAFRGEYLKTLLEKGAMEGVFTLLTEDGKRRYIEYRSKVVEKESGPSFVTVSGRDVTDRILTRRQLKKLRAQLLQSQKMEAVGSLASGVAHDFNNILQAITGYIQLASTSESLEEENRRHLGEARRAASRAADLVRRLLTFSRRLDPELRPLDLNLSVTQTLGMLERTIPKMIQIKADLDQDLKAVMADAGQIEQVLINLGTNARDAMPWGGKLVFETRNVYLDENYCRNQVEVMPGQYVLLRVSDTGSGMDQGTVNQIFDPFFTTKEVDRGTGLGLSMVYGIIKGHSGHIVCQSSPEAGTVFSIYIPAFDKAEPEDRAEVGIEEPVGGREKLLLVDDEPAINEIARRVLERQGYQVREADSGERALEIYLEKGSEIDLVLLDVGMPGMGGLNCLAELVKHDPKVRVLILSGYVGGSELPEKLQELGARGIIAKPYDPMLLLSEVRRVLDE